MTVFTDYFEGDNASCDQMLIAWELKEREKVSTLSTVQQQRLGLILAMGHHPELLVLDEPAASLDPLGRRSLLRSFVEQVCRSRTKASAKTTEASCLACVSQTPAVWILLTLLAPGAHSGASCV